MSRSRAVALSRPQQFQRSQVRWETHSSWWVEAVNAEGAHFSWLGIQILSRTPLLRLDPLDGGRGG
jgi:hypothetical protein